MYRGLWVALICTLALASIVVGCGDSSSADSLSKAEFVEEGNAICDVAERKKDAALATAINEEARKDPGSTPTKAEQEKLATDIALPPVRKMSGELNALGLPNEDADEASAIVKGYEKAVERVAENPGSVVAGATEGDPFDEVGELAEKYGLKVCARI